jgi:hypothetical protein
MLRAAKRDSLISTVDGQGARRRDKGMYGKGMKKIGAGGPPPFLIPLSPFPCPTFLCPTFACPSGRKKKRSRAEAQSRREIPPRLCASARHSVSCWRAGERVQDYRDVRRLAFESCGTACRARRVPRDLPVVETRKGTFCLLERYFSEPVSWRRGVGRPFRCRCPRFIRAAGLPHRGAGPAAPHPV